MPTADDAFTVLATATAAAAAAAVFSSLLWSWWWVVSWIGMLEVADDNTPCDTPCCDTSW